MEIKLKDRWKKKSPKLFRKITRICGGLIAIGTTIVGASAILPASLVTIGGYLIFGGTIGGTISKLTVEDKNNEEDGDQ